MRRGITNKRPGFWALCFVVCVLSGANCNHSRPTTTAPGANANVTSHSPASTPGRDSYDFTSLDNRLQQVARKHGRVALLLVTADGVIYRKGFGGHDTDDVIPIASASKWLAGAVIMSLVDEGRLSLDDKVSQYIPEFTGDRSDITIRQLFSHTSGLPAEARCRNDKRTSLERCVNEMARVQLRAAPGEEFFYGGVSMHVGGRVAEVVSGKPWNELFVERIAAPLGMTKTDFLAYGPTANPRPAGDARSSVDEYGRFLQMILQGGTFTGKRMLSEASVVEMHEDQTRGARIEYTIYEKHARLGPDLLLARYGVGVWREKVDSAGQLHEASSQGALGFSPWIDFERNLGGVLSVRGSFSAALPDYLALKEEVRRLVAIEK